MSCFTASSGAGFLLVCTLLACRDGESPQPPETAVAAPAANPPEAEEPPADAKPSDDAKADAPAAAPSPGWTFEDGPDGELPRGWTAPVGTWRIETTDTPTGEGKAFVQGAQNKSAVFNVALVAGQHADVNVSVAMRAREGRIDQGGGIVWRAADASNYYVARYNPLEDNYRLYTLKNGRRKQLASADTKLDPKAWHTLRVEMVGDRIECFVDGERVIEWQDRTFTDSGKVGLWTKADAQTQFDDFSVAQPPAGGP